MTENDERLEQERAAFVEKIGFVAQAEGLSRCAGRLFGLLVFDGGPISFGDLALRLGASRGSISTNARVLEDRGLIKRLRLPGERQDYFRLADDAYSSLLEKARRRMSAAREDIETTISRLPPEAGEIGERLSQYARFYSAMDDGLRSALQSIAATEVPQSRQDRKTEA